MSELAVAQWYLDAAYVIGIMARRNAYFTEWDIQDIIGDPPKGADKTLLNLMEECPLIRKTGHEDTLIDGSKRSIWIGV